MRRRIKSRCFQRTLETRRYHKLPSWPGFLRRPSLLTGLNILVDGRCYDSSIRFDATRLPSSHLTPEHEAWRQTVRAFVDKEILPYVNEWDEAGAFPRALHQKAAAIGLLGSIFPIVMAALGRGPMFSIV